jgi:4-amino-4-deoxy-L-arabinose transferase-like glycosyltransferase
MRILSYARNRSLFYDEINLARNYAEKDYIQLLGNLDYNQHSPPFFNWIVKLSTDIFGMNEYAFRLFPFMAGVASIFLFYKISKRFLSDFPLWFALILFGFSSYLLEYGTEVKQYSSDVFWTCLLIYSALRFPVQSLKSGIYWAIGGAIIIWFSMPVVFILAGIGFYFAFLAYRDSSVAFLKNFKSLIPIIGTWLFSFALLYLINLQHSLGSTHLAGFHEPFFLKIDNLTQTSKIIIGIVRSIVGHTAVPIIFTFLCFLTSIFHLFQKKKSHFILFSVPILTCFTASFLQQYSLIIRLTVFLFPILILMISIGLSVLYKSVNNFSNIPKKAFFTLLCIFSISCLIGRSAFRYIPSPLVKEDARTVLQKLAKEDLSEATLIVTDCGKPAFIFYTKYNEQKVDITAKKIIIHEENQPVREAFKIIPDSTTIWVFDSHTFGKELVLLQQQIEEKGTLTKSIESKSAWAMELK